MFTVVVDQGGRVSSKSGVRGVYSAVIIIECLVICSCIFGFLLIVRLKGVLFLVRSFRCVVFVFCLSLGSKVFHFWLDLFVRCFCILVEF